LIDTSQIKPHMDIIASDGERVGSVDHMEGTDRIKVTRHDPSAHKEHHHFIPIEWVARVHDHVHLSKASQDVKAHWEHET